MKKILEREGHDVRDACDGAEGMRMFRADPVDVVVTDLIMPNQEGIETILALRAEFPAVRILAVSGNLIPDLGGRLSDAQLLGADASLAKPFTVDQLRSAVAALLA